MTSEVDSNSTTLQLWGGSPEPRRTPTSGFSRFAPPPFASRAPNPQLASSIGFVSQFPALPHLPPQIPPRHKGVCQNRHPACLPSSRTWPKSTLGAGRYTFAGQPAKTAARRARYSSQLPGEFKPVPDGVEMPHPATIPSWLLLPTASLKASSIIFALFLFASLTFCGACARRPHLYRTRLCKLRRSRGSSWLSWSS